MLQQFVNISDGGSFFFTDFSDPSYRPLFMDSAFYKVVFCKRGQAKVLVDDRPTLLQHNELLFCKPLQSVRLPSLKGVEVAAIAFNRTFYPLRDDGNEQSFFWLWYYNTQELVKIRLSEGEETDFRAIFTCFAHELDHQDGICQEMLLYVLKRLFAKTNAKVIRNGGFSNIQQNRLRTIARFHKLIEAHFREKHQVAEYASLLAKSPKTLANVFRSYGMKSPSKLLHERLILEAKRLLLNTQKTAEEITYELGYQHAGHFSKFFKRHVGVSPIDYRNRHLQASLELLN